MAGSRYAVEGVLGRGGIATVYLARDTELDRYVALKVLDEDVALDEGARARFVREARMAASRVHPNVVQVYDAGEDEGRLFIAMEYVDGGTLAAYLDSHGRLPVPEVVRLGGALCAALQVAHSAGLVHRDVKPQNILRTSDGVYKLTDFGLARRLGGTTVTQPGGLLEAAGYLAPEQGRGDPVTAAADIYAIGVVLYQALMGRLPYEASSLAELQQLRERDAIVPPSALVADVPERVERAILHALELAPADRPRSAAALAGELGAGTAPATTVGMPAVPAPAPSRRRRRARVAVLAAVVVGPARGDRARCGDLAGRGRLPWQCRVEHDHRDAAHAQHDDGGAPAADGASARDDLHDRAGRSRRRAPEGRPARRSTGRPTRLDVRRKALEGRRGDRAERKALRAGSQGAQGAGQGAPLPAAARQLSGRPVSSCAGDTRAARRSRLRRR